MQNATVGEHLLVLHAYTKTKVERFVKKCGLAPLVKKIHLNTGEVKRPNVHRTQVDSLVGPHR